MLLVPIQDTSTQQIKVTLAAQNCLLNLYQLDNSTVAANDTAEVLPQQVLYMDVYVGTTAIIVGVACQNLNSIVRDLYLGFIGDFVFNDSQGMNDPTSPGLGSRYQLIYLEATDLPPGQG
jgi:hypothetical protein